MTRHGFILLALAIVAVAGWAYNVNYNTMTALDRVSSLRGQIAKERETLQVLRVEWAYLNAPERLARLVRDHNSHLRLAPMQPEDLSDVAVVPYPSKEWVPDETVYPTRHDGIVPVPRPRPASWRQP